MPYADTLTLPRVQPAFTSQADRLTQGLGDKLASIIRREQARQMPSAGNEALDTLDKERLVTDIRTSLMGASNAVYDLVIGLKDREANQALVQADATLPNDLKRYITEYLAKGLSEAIMPDAYDERANAVLEQEKATVSAKLEGVKPEKSMVEKAAGWLKKLKGQEAPKASFGQRLLEAMDKLMDQAIGSAVEKTGNKGAKGAMSI